MASMHLFTNTFPLPVAWRTRPGGRARKRKRTHDLVARDLMETTMSNFGNPQKPLAEPTRATARLPGLDIEIVHRRSTSGDAEQISINLQAVPSFEAFGRFVESVNPFAFWTQVMQVAWLPWLAAAQAALPPGMTLPVGLEATTHSADSRATAVDVARAT